MRLANVPQAALVRLLALDDHAKQLTEAAERHERRIADVRARLNGKRVSSKDNYAALEAELPRLVETQPKVRARAQREQQVLSSCKYFLDQLPDGSTLDIVEVQPSADLPITRARIAKLVEERRALINAPPSPAELSAEVKRWVVAIGEQGKPSMLLRDAAFTPRWGGSGNADPSPTPRNLLAFLAWFAGDALMQRFQAELEAQASALSLLSRAERERRLAEIEAATLQLRYEEEVLIGAALARGDEDVTRDAAAPPEAVLQIQTRSRSAEQTSSAARVEPLAQRPGSSAPVGLSAEAR